MNIQVLQTALLKHLHDLNTSRKEIIAMQSTGKPTEYLTHTVSSELVDQIETCQQMITALEGMASTVNPIKTLFQWTNNKSSQGSKRL